MPNLQFYFLSVAFSNGEIGVNLEGASGPIDLNENGEPDYGPVSIWEPVGNTNVQIDAGH